MAKRPSIGLRLAIGLSAGMAVFWLGAAAISGNVMRRELTDSFDETLRQAAYRILPLALHNLREPEEAHERRITDLDDGQEYFTYYIRDPDGRIVIQAEDAPPFHVTDTVEEGFGSVHGKRYFVKTDPRNGYSIVVAENSDHRSEALTDSLAALVLPLAGLIPLTAAGIWFAVRLAMRPVERLRADIAKRNSQDLSPLSQDGHPAELAPIADAVADLLQRLGAALDAERAFAASSAHELRTPIAGALAQTQQLAIELGNNPAAGRLKEIEASLKHLSQLSEKLLQLSRIEAGFARSDTMADLIPIIRLIGRDFESSEKTRGRVQVMLPEAGTVLAPIDVDAFSIALRNLIQNALIHGTPGGQIDVIADTDRTIRVRNACPVIPPDTLRRLGEPFVRGATSASGSGLGLSIVRTIMEQTGGTLVLRSPASDRTDGFEAILHWPSRPGT